MTQVPTDRRPPTLSSSPSNIIPASSSSLSSSFSPALRSPSLAGTTITLPELLIPAGTVTLVVVGVGVSRVVDVEAIKTAVTVVVDTGTEVAGVGRLDPGTLTTPMKEVNLSPGEELLVTGLAAATTDRKVVGMGDGVAKERLACVDVGSTGATGDGALT